MLWAENVQQLQIEPRGNNTFLCDSDLRVTCSDDRHLSHLVTIEWEDERQPDNLRGRRRGNLFNIMNDSAPSYLMESVHLVQSQHSYSTRISELSFAIPRVCTSGKCSFPYTSILHWNGLPVDIKNIHSKSRFLNAVKKHLRSRLLWREKRFCTLLINYHSILIVFHYFVLCFKFISRYNVCTYSEWCLQRSSCSFYYMLYYVKCFDMFILF